MTGAPHPAHAQVLDQALSRVYEVYADFVMKNPFYSPEMPIRCDQFDVELHKAVKAMQPVL